MTVRRWGLRYRAHNGVPRVAVLLLRNEYGPENPPAPLPLVISPHGRGIRGATNADWWRDLPALGDFAVVCPGGMGRRLPLHSWGWRGQIDDLAQMPQIVQHAKPWLRIEGRRVYAVGGSMGGQETLLLLGQHPRLLAGAAAFDSVTNFYTRYRDFARIRNGLRLQAPGSLDQSHCRVGGAVTTLVERCGRDCGRSAAAVRRLLRRAPRASSAWARRVGAWFVEPHGRDIFGAPAACRCEMARPSPRLAHAQRIVSSE
jgi:poly(3-hydroxybutyrate) depolymerase